MAEPPPTPRWVKVSGAIVGVLVLLFLIVLFTGGPESHGPGRHSAPPSATAEIGVQPA